MNFKREKKSLAVSFVIFICIAVLTVWTTQANILISSLIADDSGDEQPEDSVAEGEGEVVVDSIDGETLEEVVEDIGTAEEVGESSETTNEEELIIDGIVEEESEDAYEEEPDEEAVEEVPEETTGEQALTEVPEESPPEVSIDITYTADENGNLLAGEEISFGASIEGIEVLEYRWDFGDVDVSSEESLKHISYEKSPKHIYSSEGSYTLSLEVIGIEGGSYSKSIIIVVIAADEIKEEPAGESAGEEAAAEEEVVVDSIDEETSEGIVEDTETTVEVDESSETVEEVCESSETADEEELTYDGIIEEEEPYEEAVEAVEEEQVLAEASEEITPEVNIELTYETDENEYLLVGEESSFGVSVEGIEVLEYRWDFGDGEVSSDANPQHIYTADGNYTISLEIIDQDNNSYIQSTIVHASDYNPYTTEYWVSSDADGGIGTIDSPFTIDSAFSNIVNGDTIHFLPGTYYESVNLNDIGTGTEDLPINFIAYDNAIFDGQSIYDHAFYYTSPLSYLGFYNFTFMNYLDSAISIDNEDVTNIDIVDNIFSGNGTAIDITMDSDLNIQNNIIVDNDVGVIISSDNASIEHNVIAFNEQGIIVEGINENVVVDYNDVYANDIGYQGVDAGENDISLDPMFADKDNLDFTLLKDSPLLDNKIIRISSTNKDDYFYGEQVIITGSGYEPFQDLIIKILRPDGTFVKNILVTTDENGNFTYEEYYVDYAGKDYLIEITDTEGSILEVLSFTDDDIRGSVTAQKVDQDTIGLGGATIGLYTNTAVDGSGTWTLVPGKTVTSGAGGSVYFDDLDLDTNYWVHEINAPSGYTADPNYYGPVTPTASYPDKILTSPDDDIVNTINYYYYYNSDYVFYEVDGNGPYAKIEDPVWGGVSGLCSVTFNISGLTPTYHANVPTCGPPYIIWGVFIKAGNNELVIIDTDGDFNLGGSSPGDCYRVSGIGTSIVTVTELKQEAGVAPAISHINFYYKCCQAGSVTVTKDGLKDGDTATFKLYNSGGQVGADIVVSTATSLTGTWTGLAHGAYWVEETPPATGYSGISWEIKSGTTEIYSGTGSRMPGGTDTFTIGDDTGEYLEISINVDNEAEGEVTVNKTGLDEGDTATFKLYNSGGQVGADIVVSTATSLTGTWTGLAHGAYWVEESTLTGYCTPSWTINPYGTTGTGYTTDTFTVNGDTPNIVIDVVNKHCDIKVSKSGLTGSDTATFTISGPSGFSDLQTIGNTIYTWTDLEWGTYTITESGYSAGGYTVSYTVTDSSGAVVDSGTRDTVTVTIGDGENESLSFTIYVTNTKKTTPPTGSITLNKTGLASTAEAGFTLYNSSGAAIGPEKTVTGSGSVSWTGLSYGTYYIVETTVPGGYMKMDDITSIVIGPGTMTHSFTRDNTIKTTTTVAETIEVLGITELPFTGLNPFIPISGMAIMIIGVVMVTLSMTRRRKWRHALANDFTSD